MFERFASWIRSVTHKMFGNSAYSRANLPKTIITDDMASAIDRWIGLYYNNAPWLNQNRLSIGIPMSIAREIATLVTLEAKVVVSEMQAGGGAASIGNGNSAAGNSNIGKANSRASFIRDALKPVLTQLATRTEYACAFGGIVFKPYKDGDKVSIDFVNADNFYPTTFNSKGDITGAVFVEKLKKGDTRFVRLEEHNLNGTSYTISNRAFKSYSGNDFGDEITLDSLPEWAQIEPVATIENISEPLFAYFKIPHGNVVDVESQLGVSVYARADKAGLLEEADKQMQRLAWEFDGGQMAIDVSSDAFKISNGKAKLPDGKERLYRVNEFDSAVTGAGSFNVFAPGLRDNSYINGLNKTMQIIEDMCGIARGTFSDPNDVARTATELKISKQRTYATVTSIQMALQNALEHLVKSIDTIASLYNLAPKGAYEVSYTWDDSIVIDAETEREKDRTDVHDGLMLPWEYRVKWYGETQEQAKAILDAGKGESDDEIMGFKARLDSLDMLNALNEPDV